MSLHLNILNFIKDDKFLDTAIKNHDSVADSVTHHYVLIVNSKENKHNYIFKYIKQINRIDILYSTEIEEYINKNNIHAIILHSLNSVPHYIIPQIKRTIPILWFAWGYDLYEQPYLDPFIYIHNMYHPYTKKLIKGITRKRRGLLKNTIANIRDLLVYSHLYIPPKTRDAKKSLQRINFFSGIIGLEYIMMKNNPTFFAEEAIYSYKSLYDENKITPATGEKILLGNSGSPNNNHVDILHLLKGRGIKNTPIICPVNYGKDQTYIKAVCQIGRDLYSEMFQPITEFLPKTDYLNLIKECSTVIIGTMRQQAMGNIAIAIYMGCKIFFYKQSVLYNHFKSNGYIVFSIEDDLTNESITTRLTEEEIKYNIQLYNKLSSERWNQNALRRIYTQFKNYLSSLQDI